MANVLTSTPPLCTSNVLSGWCSNVSVRAVRNDSHCSRELFSFSFPRIASLTTQFQSYVSAHHYSHSLPFSFPVSAITTFRLIAKRRNVYSIAYHAFKNYQVTPAALFIVILHHYYLSLFIISHSIVNFHCSACCHCMLRHKNKTFITHIKYTVSIPMSLFLFPFLFVA